jgi:hypothetical protein
MLYKKVRLKCKGCTCTLYNVFSTTHYAMLKWRNTLTLTQHPFRAEVHTHSLTLHLPSPMSSENTSKPPSAANLVELSTCLPPHFHSPFSLFTTVERRVECLAHGLIKYKDTKTKCRLYWCLIEFIDWRYRQRHVGFFDSAL